MGSMDPAKKTAAQEAVNKEIVPLLDSQKEVIVGIGSGSTVVFVAEYLGQIIKDHKATVKCVPTSFQAKDLIISNHLTMTNLEECPQVDITIDGVDESDSKLNSIKGGGGCLLQEKVVAYFSKRMVAVADYTKASEKLGDQWKKGVPIEVLPLCWVPVQKRIQEQFGGQADLRMAVKKMGPVVTDNGNFLMDWKFPDGDIDWESMSVRLKMIPGVVETGLFCNLVRRLYIGNADGSCSVRN